jgi:hypothetical protein
MEGGYMSNRRELFKQRVDRVADAVVLKEPDQVPIVAQVSGLPYHLYGESSSHKATYYDPEKAVAAIF